MNCIKEEEYIVSFQGVVHIFSLINTILVLKKFKDNKEIDRIELMYNVKYFSVDISNSKNINIIVVNFSEDLVYITNENNIWKETLITSFNNKIYVCEYLKIYSHYNIIHALILSNNQSKNEYNLIHYLIIENEIKYTKVLYLSNKKDYKIDMDTNGNIHIIYKKSDNNNNIFYRTFNLEYNRWGIPEKIVYEQGNIKDMCILCATCNLIYVVYFNSNKNNIKLNWLYKKNNSNFISNWNNPDISRIIIGDFCDPLLIQLDDNIRLIWKQNSKFHFVNVKIGEYINKNIVDIDLEFDYNLIPIVYIGNNYKNFKSTKIPYTYRCLSNEIILIGIDDIKKDNKLAGNKANSSYLIQYLENAITLEDARSIEYSLLEYVSHIKHYLKKSNIVLDLLNDNKILNEEKLINNKILKLKKEIEDLRSSKEFILNSLCEIKSDYENLNKKYENILIEYNYLKDQKQEKSLLKILKDFFSFFLKI